MDTCGSFIVDGDKKYVLMMVCLVTRAITLEPIDSLENKQWVLLFGEWEQDTQHQAYFTPIITPQFKTLEEITRDMSDKQVCWMRIPTKASWMGGVYERMMPNIKQALYQTFHGRTLTSQQFQTTLLEIEATINSRLLTYIGTVDDPQPLTPNDFLQAKFEDTEKTPILPETNNIDWKTLLAFYYQSWAILNVFWKTWATTYLQELRERHSCDHKNKKQHTTEIPKVGEVVILYDAIQKRNYWPLAVIQELGTSDDGKVRSALVRTQSNQVTQQAISHLLSLIHISEPTRPY